MSTSTRYREIREEVVKQFSPQDKSPWYLRFGRLWLRRVGIPRLTAEQVAIEAAGLLRSIHPSTFRNDPAAHELLLVARNAVIDLGVAIGTENWKRFKGEDHD